MKVLSLKLNLENINDLPDKLTKNKLISRMIFNLIETYALQKRIKGLDYTEQRIFYKLNDKLEEAKKNNLDKIELEDAWFELLKKAMKEAKMQPSTIINRFFDLIEEADKNNS